MSTHTFKQFLGVCYEADCPEQNNVQKVFGWSYDLPLPCPACTHTLSHITEHGPNQTVYIATDDIPGGIEIRHGICNEDGSPRRFYSKTEIKREANRRGVTLHGDTPKPYKV